MMKLMRKVKDHLKRLFSGYYYTNFFLKMSDFKALSDANEKSKTHYFINYYASVFKYGVDKSEYFIYKFYDLNNNEKKAFVTRLSKFSLYPKCNNQAIKPIFDNKATFNQEFSDFLQRDWVYCLEDKRDMILQFIENHNSFLLKPTNLNGGRGIKKIERLQLDDLNAFVSDCIKRNVLLEEIVIQNSQFAYLNDSSVNTIRFLTMVNRDGVTHHLSAILRVGKKGNIVDNVSQGGIMYPIDIDTGKVSGVGMDGKGNKHTVHPGTEFEMIGFLIPSWKEILKTVDCASKVISSARLVAWDITVDFKGNPVIIEGNLTPNPRTIQLDGVGKQQIIEGLI